MESISEIPVNRNDNDYKISKFLKEDIVIHFGLRKSHSNSISDQFRVKGIVGSRTTLIDSFDFFVYVFIDRTYDIEKLKEHAITIINKPIYEWIISSYRRNHELKYFYLKTKFDLRNDTIRRIKSKLNG